MRRIFRQGPLAAIACAVVCLSQPCHASTEADLATKIQALQSSNQQLTQKVSALSTSVVNAISFLSHTNVGQCPMFVVNVTTTTTVPLSFFASAQAVAGVQADIVLPSSTTVSSVTIGPAGTAAQKSVQFSMVGNAARVIVFGLNQTSIASGVLATMKITRTGASGFRPLAVTNPVATDAAGNNVPICVTSGGSK